MCNYGYNSGRSSCGRNGTSGNTRYLTMNCVLTSFDDDVFYGNAAASGCGRSVMSTSRSCGCGRDRNCGCGW